MNKRQVNKYFEWFDEWTDTCSYKDLPKMHLWKNYSKKLKHKSSAEPKSKHKGNTRFRRVLYWDYRNSLLEWGKKHEH